MHDFIQDLFAAPFVHLRSQRFVGSGPVGLENVGNSFVVARPLRLLIHRVDLVFSRV